MSVPGIATRPKPRPEYVGYYSLTSGDMRYPYRYQVPTNDVTWDAVLGVVFYDNSTIPYSAFTTPGAVVSGVTALGAGELATQCQWAASYVTETELVPPSSSDSPVSYRMTNSQSSDGSRILMSTGIFLTGCRTGADTVEDLQTGFGAYTGVFALPSVTPTEDGSTVIHVLFLNNDVSTLDSTNYSEAPDFFDQQVTTTGSDATLLVSMYYDCPAGVAVAPTFTAEGTAGDWSAITLLVPPRAGEVTQPYVVPQSFKPIRVGSSQSNVPAVLPTSADCDVEYGDILVVTVDNSRKNNSSELSNTGAYDHVLIAPGAYTAVATMLLKRLTSPADLDAMAASPPVVISTGLSTATMVNAFLIRGIQGSGPYLYSSSTANPATGSRVVPVTAAEVTDTILSLVFIDTLYAQLSPGTLGRPEHIWWQQTNGGTGSNTRALAMTPAGSTGSFNQTWTWGTNSQWGYVEATLVTAKPTHKVQASLGATAEVSTVLTAEVGARYVSSTVFAPVDVVTDVEVQRVRIRKPARPLVWLYGLNGVRKNVLD